MSKDARFEDGAEAPLRLVATDAEDLSVVSSLVQDAVLPATEISWQPKDKRLSLLLNRFRWEDAPAAERGNRSYERVQSVLTFNDVQGVSSQGIDRKDQDTVLSLLEISFSETEAPSGHLELTFAGDGALRLKVETLEVVLKDVTRPYVAPSGLAPSHSA
ncbi:MAG: DUF2948 family protein [Pseudomonadota bacterium]